MTNNKNCFNCTELAKLRESANANLSAGKKWSAVWNVTGRSGSIKRRKMTADSDDF